MRFVVSPEGLAILALMQPDQEIISAWRASAPFWEKHREIIRQMFAPVTHALVEDGLIGSGNTVLDIATGAGEPALTIAALVGSEGRVFGIDPAPEMVDAARRATDHLGRNAQFEVASADRLPFPADTFDAVVSRFGVMFFPSPVDGVREMLRVLKPGRKLALAVWHFAENNPFHYALARVIERFVDSPPPAAPDAADAFRFASPGKLRAALAEAGAMSPCERLLQFTIQASTSVEDFWTVRCEMSEKLREKLATLSGEQLTEVKRQALEVLRGYSTERGMSFPAEVLIVTGTKIRQT
jgi:ubiquinone/menaquinone biosynthesis C-methylase UbiE